MSIYRKNLNLLCFENLADQVRSLIPNKKNFLKRSSRYKKNNRKKSKKFKYQHIPERKKGENL